ncbi:hypothetical protein KNO81_41255 [Paraburkholderia sediminicola]|jgi:hypothetical protein|nr:hypothetical protein [Paraburkholderia sediminicola]
MSVSATVNIHATRRRAAFRRKPARRIVLTAPTGITLFLGIAETGNIQFPGATPAFVDSIAAMNTQQTQQQPHVRRGPEPSTPTLILADPRLLSGCVTSGKVKQSRETKRHVYSVPSEDEIRHGHAVLQAVRLPHCADDTRIPSDSPVLSGGSKRIPATFFGFFSKLPSCI